MLGGCGNLTAHFGHYELQCVTLRPWDTYKMCLFKSVALSECPLALTGMSVRESVCVWCVCGVCGVCGWCVVCGGVCGGVCVWLGVCGGGWGVCGVCVVCVVCVWCVCGV